MAVILENFAAAEESVATATLLSEDDLANFVDNHPRSPVQFR